MRPPNGGLRKGDWLVQSVTQAAARTFVKQHHYAVGVAAISTVRHGMYRADPAWLPLVGELVGVALWVPPTRTAAESVAVEGNWRGVLALSRLAVHPSLPTNAASFLLGRSMRLLDRSRWTVLLTYADLAQGHTGAIYKATNWRCVGVTDMGDTWTDPAGRQWGRKRGDKTFTATEMRAAGLTRNVDQRRLKFVHP